MKRTAAPPHSRAPVLSRLLNQAAGCGAALARDNVRLPLQTVGAVLLAYASMKWLGLPEVAWAAFSALFVVRASVEGTVGEAGARILGAFIGVALGVSLVLLSQAAGVAAFWSIVAGVGLAAYLSMRWPSLSYSLVTVTILTITPGDDIVSGALHKAAAIVVGSASGILAAVAILPRSARRSVRINLADSIEAYGDLLVQWATALSNGSQRPRLGGQSTMEQARRRAQDMASQARTFPMDMLYRHTVAYRLYSRIDGLWRTATLLERAGTVPLSDNICRRLGPALDKLATAAKKQVDGLAQAVRKNSRAAAPRRPGAPLARLNEVIEDAMHHRAFDATEKEAVEVIRWAWHEVAQELDALADHLDAGLKRKAGKHR